MTAPATPLPATADNVLAGALRTAMVFPLAVATLFAAVSGNPAAGVFMFVVSFFGAGVVAIVAIPLVGVPLALVASRMLRNVASVRWHLLGQFFAGTIAGCVVILVYLTITRSLDNIGPASTVALAGMAAVTGLAAMTGWYLALRRERRKTLPDPFGTADEDFD